LGLYGKVRFNRLLCMDTLTSLSIELFPVQDPSCNEAERIPVAM